MPEPTHRRRRLAVACLVTTACDETGAPASAGPSTTAAPDTATPTPTRTPPPAPGLAAVAADDRAGVHGELLQFRRDVARRRLEVHLVAANAGLVVEQLQLRAPGLTIVSALDRPAGLRARAGLDLPVTMGPADCTVDPGAPVVTLQLRDDTGAERTVDVPLEDDGLVGRLHEEDCAEQRLRSEVDMGVVAVTPVDTASGPALRVSIELRRVGGEEPVRVTGTGSNTVYDITAHGSLPTLRTGSARFQVDMVPARCDVHALGESYRTGLIGLVLALGDAAPRPLVLSPADDVRGQLETFAVTTCRTPPD